VVQLLLLCLFAFFVSCTTRPLHEKEELAVKRKQVTHLPVVVIDPGHGGESVGTKTVTLPHVYEKTLALQCALKVTKYLEDWGYRVILTRNKDLNVALAKRVQIAKGGALFVSIHFNHAPNANANGVEVYYYDSKKDQIRKERSKLLAKDILRAIVRETDCFSRGVHAGDFHVIRENIRPAVLVEGGFCSNIREAKKLINSQYQTKLALGIAKGIDAFVLSES